MRRLFLLSFVMLIMIGLVSAQDWTFDNFESYDEEKKMHSVYDLIGGNITDSFLITDQFVDKSCSYDNVTDNLKCFPSSEPIRTHVMRITSYEDYEDLLGEIETFDTKKDMKKIIKEYDLRYLTYVEEESDTYEDEETCDTQLPNGTYVDCYLVKNGTKTEMVEEWVPVKYNSFKKDQPLIVGIYTNISDGEKVDIVPTIAGRKVQQWATIEGDFLVGIRLSYSMDTGNVTTVDDTGNFTRTAVSVTNTSGIIESGYDFTGAARYIPVNNVSDVVNYANGTVEMWVKPDDCTPAGNQYFFFHYDNTISPSEDRDRFYLQLTTAGNLFFVTSTAAAGRTLTYSAAELCDGDYHQVAVTFDQGTTIAMYINGIQVINSTTADNNPFSGNQLFYFGTQDDGSSLPYSGDMDNVRIWDYALTPAQMLTLNNNNQSIPYASDNEEPVVNLVAPANDTTVNSNGYSATFQATVYDSAQDIDNCTLLVWNQSDSSLEYTQTNTSIVNNSLVSFNQVLMASNYSWNMLCIDNESAEGTNSTNWTINVIPIPDNAPIVTLNSPANNTVYTSSPISVSTNCTASDDNQLDNVSLMINSVINSTNTSGVNNSNYIFTNSYYDGVYDWSCRATDNESQQTQPTTRRFTVDGNDPVVNITAPADGFIVTQFNQSIALNWTAVDATLESCWYNLNDTGTNVTVTCALNTTTINYPTTTPNSVLVTFFANDSVGNEDSDSVTILKSTVEPNVTITAPANGTVVTEFNQSIDLNWTVTSPDVDSCWYNFGEEYETCYQESPNVTNQTGIDGDCGLLYNGTYTFSSLPASPENTVDGSFSTFSTYSTDDYYVNYTKPSGASFGSKIRNRVTTGTDQNLTVPIGCWNEFSDRLHFRVRQAGASVFLQCEDSTETGGWRNILIRVGTTFYEEAMVWNISLNNEVNCSDATTTINYPTSNPDSLDIFFFSNDTLGNTGNDSVTIVKSTTAPVINITSPADSILKVVNGENLSLNWTISNTTVLDTCQYEYNGTNTTVGCLDGNTSFLYVKGENSITFYANDTLGNLGNDSKSFVIRLFEDAVEYSATVFEGSTQDFSLNVTVGAGESIAEAHLIYDGGVVNDTSTLRISGLDYVLENDIQIPDVVAEDVLDFYWEIVLTNPTTVNSSTFNQTVQPINIDDCDNYTVIIYNLSMYDEQSREFITPGTYVNTSIEVDLEIASQAGADPFIVFSKTFNDTNPAQICLDQNLTTTSYIAAIQIRYSATNRTTELYHIDNDVLDNSTIARNIGLYPLNLSFATSFNINYKGPDFLAVEGAIVQINRKYIGSGEFVTVEAPKTDENGQVVGNFQIENVVYTINVVKDGVMLATFDNIVVRCENPLTGECSLNLDAFESSTDFSDWDTVGDLTYNVQFDEDQRTTFVQFNTVTGSARTISVVGTRFDGVGNTTVCSDSLFSSAGTLTCNVSQSYGNVSVIFEVASNDDVVTTATVYFGVNFVEVLGNDSFFFVLILFFIIPLLFIPSTIGMVVAGILGVIMSMTLLFVDSTTLFSKGAALTWLIIAGIIIIWKITKRENV